MTSFSALYTKQYQGRKQLKDGGRKQDIVDWEWSSNNFIFQVDAFQSILITRQHKEGTMRRKQEKLLLITHVVHYKPGT